MSTATGSPMRKQLDELEELLQRMLSLPVNPNEPAAPAPPPPTPAQPASGLYPATFSISADSIPPGQIQSPAGSTPPPPPRAIAPPVRPAPPPPRYMPPVRRIDPAPGDPTWSVPLPAGSSPPPTVMNSWPMGIEATSQQMRPAPPQRPITPMAPSQPAVMQPPVNLQAQEQAANPFGGLRVESIPAPQPIYPGYAAATYPQAERLPVTHWPAAAADWLCGNIVAMFGPPGQWLGQGRGKPIVGWLGWMMLAGAIAWGVVDYLGLSW